MATRSERIAGPMRMNVNRVDVVEAGKHRIIVTMVDMSQRPGFVNKNVWEDCFRWTFKTKEGNKTLQYKTNCTYGNPDAGLTTVIDALFGRSLTDEEAGGLDVRECITMECDAILNSKQDQQTKKFYNEFVTFLPIRDEKTPVK